MLYLLDANVLITANNSYYAIDQVPEFWDWLQHQAACGEIKMPIEIIEEVKPGRTENDLLFEWIRESENQEVLLLEEDVDPALVRRVVRDGYSNDLTDDEIEQLGRDPFLIAYGMAGAERCVVTTEVSKPSKIRHNRKIPNVCDTLSVRCEDPFTVYRALGFRTDWRS